MSDELYRYQSNSNPGKYYHIIRGNDGVIYCDCPSWRMSPAPKDCKHLRDFNSSTPRKIKVIKVPNVPNDPYESIQKAIDNEVKNLS